MTGETNQFALEDNIRKFYGECVRNPEGCYRSWDHCHGFSREHRSDLHWVQDTAALHLGCYLAIWGMYRGRNLLSTHTYLVHLPVIRVVASSRFSNLSDLDCRTQDHAVELGQTIMELVEVVRDGYRQFGKEPTDVLVTRVLLGTVGCLPVCDQFFKQGWRNQGFSFGRLNEYFIQIVLRFCVDNRAKLTELRLDIIDLYDLPYPLMKLVDMHFWRIGHDL